MAITQSSVLPQQYISQLGQDYGQQLAGLTSIPLDTSQFAPQVAGQDPLQTQAATLAGSGVGAYQPYLTEAAALGTQAATTMGGVSPYISAAGALTGTGAGTGAGSIASYMPPYQQQVIDTSLAEFDKHLEIAIAEAAGISKKSAKLVDLTWEGLKRDLQAEYYPRLNRIQRVLLPSSKLNANGYREIVNIFTRLPKNIDTWGMFIKAIDLLNKELDNDIIELLAQIYFDAPGTGMLETLLGMLEDEDAIESSVLAQAAPSNELDLDETDEFACVEPALDLLNYSTNGLHIPQLVHRSRHGKVLSQRHPCQCGK